MRSPEDEVIEYTGICRTIPKRGKYRTRYIAIPAREADRYGVEPGDSLHVTVRKLAIPEAE